MTTVADRVAAKIARQAATEVIAPGEGLVLRSTASQASKAVDTAVDVRLPLTGTVDSQALRLQDHVEARVRHLTGLAATPPTIRVRQLAAVAPRTMSGAAAVSDSSVRRTWSERRLTTAVLAAALTVVSYLLLWHAVELRGTPSPPWQPPDAALSAAGQRGMWCVAAAAAVMGGWMVLLALTPGHHRLLTLRCGPAARAVMSRMCAARLVQAALADVPGLRVRTVRFAPRRVSVRAELAFGEPEGTRQAAIVAISGAIDGLALSRTPRVKLTLDATRLAKAPTAGHMDRGADNA
ncbi:DUF6286 domain-containing protein [Streptomyces sp. NPDC059193]|uniref:DUF6286 domain-containing protein n=1 Tax=Streptomyces sp. NPDC059193 TaxID=3346763 RepID=UPI0036C9519C